MTRKVAFDTSPSCQDKTKMRYHEASTLEMAVQIAAEILSNQPIGLNTANFITCYWGTDVTGRFIHPTEFFIYFLMTFLEP